jgi:DNA-binding Lrp family transcriptional regulator
MFNKRLKIDDVDKMIISLLQENPEMTHSDISEKVNKSQPAIGARIIKLKRKHLIETQIGADFKEIDIKLAKIEMLTKDVSSILEKIEHCPFVINAFKTSGNTNLCAMICAPEIQIIDKMVDLCFRSDEKVISVNTNYIISAVKKLVLPLNFDIERFDEFGCGKNCLIKAGKAEELQKLIKDSRMKSIEQAKKIPDEESEDSEEEDENSEELDDK